MFKGIVMIIQVIEKSKKKKRGGGKKTVLSLVLLAINIFPLTY